MRYEILEKMRDCFKNGENIITNKDVPSDERIEIAYELQAGSYIEFFRNNILNVSRYVEEISTHINESFPSAKSILDCGCGELTTTSELMEFLWNIECVFAFDSSLSRVFVGREWMRNPKNISLNPKFEKIYGLFCSNLNKIPMEDEMIDIGFSNHAIESNRGLEIEIIKEIARVSRLGVALAEPSYELSEETQRARMEELGYAKGICEAMKYVGLKNIKTFKIKNSINPKNETTLHIGFKESNDKNEVDISNFDFVDLIGQSKLKSDDGYTYLKSERGVVYPIIEGIPVIKEHSQILFSMP